jgi:hypothetical protein
LIGQLILKGASASRPSGVWKDDDYDVLAEPIDKANNPGSIIRATIIAALSVVSEVG